MENFCADMVDAHGLINNEPMTRAEHMMNGGLSTNDTQVALGEQFNDNHEITCHGREIINKKTIIETNVSGKIVSINRWKHYFFIRRDNVRCRDIFGREASIIGAVHKPKCLLLDECVFDIAQTTRGIEALNINVHKRKTSDILKLKKIPKKEQKKPQTPASALFQTTIIGLFREAARSK